MERREVAQAVRFLVEQRYNGENSLYYKGGDYLPPIRLYITALHGGMWSLEEEDNDTPELRRAWHIVRAAEKPLLDWAIEREEARWRSEGNIHIYPPPLSVQPWSIRLPWRL